MFTDDRALFPEICDKFEENLSHCFSAGNPEKFHLHYTHSMEFLDTFESKLPFIEILEEFRASGMVTKKHKGLGVSILGGGALLNK